MSNITNNVCFRKPGMLKFLLRGPQILYIFVQIQSNARLLLAEMFLRMFSLNLA